MKAFLLINISLIALSGSVYSQCPAGGLVIRGAGCEDPKNLAVDAVTCSALKIKWLGSKSQTYIVKASGTDPVTNSNYEAKTSQSACNGNGNCTATIPVKAGSTIRWSVQAICQVQHASVYSTEISGQETYIADCEKGGVDNYDHSIRVYPNPANDYLMVVYTGNVAGSLAFRVTDLSGKQILGRQEEGAVKVNASYKLDISRLVPGMYMLEAVNGNRIAQTKFEVLRH